MGNRSEVAAFRRHIATQADDSDRAEEVWLVRTPLGGGGTGTSILRDDESPPFGAPRLLSRYVHDPLLLDGRKAEVRVFVLVDSAFRADGGGDEGTAMRALLYNRWFYVRKATAPHDPTACAAIATASGTLRSLPAPCSTNTHQGAQRDFSADRAVIAAAGGEDAWRERTWPRIRAVAARAVWAAFDAAAAAGPVACELAVIGLDLLLADDRVFLLEANECAGSPVVPMVRDLFSYVISARPSPVEPERFGFELLGRPE